VRPATPKDEDSQEANDDSASNQDEIVVKKEGDVDI
jgi:hypothetical protein